MWPLYHSVNESVSVCMYVCMQLCEITINKVSGWKNDNLWKCQKRNTMCTRLFSLQCNLILLNSTLFFQFPILSLLSQIHEANDIEKKNTNRLFLKMVGMSLIFMLQIFMLMTTCSGQLSWMMKNWFLSIIGFKSMSSHQELMNWINADC